MKKKVYISFTVLFLLSTVFTFSQGTLLNIDEESYSIISVDGQLYVKLVDLAEILNGELISENDEYIIKKTIVDGRITYADGGFYEGELQGDLYHGHGYRMYSDGSYYNGQWKEGLYNGEGIYRDVYGNLYEGLFENGFKMGHGEMTYANTDVYRGNWTYNFRTDFGRYYYANGDKYVGYWKNNLYDGAGILFEGRFEKRGEWEHGIYMKPLTKKETDFKGL